MNRLSRGFTLIEVLVVIVIALVLATITVAAFSNIRSHFAHRVALQDIHTALIDARVATLSAKNDTVHGVHIETTKVVLFEGATYSAGAASNKEYPFSYGVTATASLSPSGSDVVFTRLTGGAASSGTITVTEPRSGRTSTVTIHRSGLIEL